jgi:hypothetical protein
MGQTAPLPRETTGREWRSKICSPAARKDKRMEIGGIFGLLILIADVWAIINIVQSGTTTGKKVLWTVLVLLLPVLGLILWLLMGPRTGRI